MDEIDAWAIETADLLIKLYGSNASRAAAASRQLAVSYNDAILLRKWLRVMDFLKGQPPST